VLEVKRLGARGKMHDDVRAAGLESRHAGNEPACAEGWQHSQIQHVSRAAVAHYFLGGIRQGGQAGAYLAGITAPRVGQGHALALPVKQRHAEMFLELL
jgi:hypothetical protein